MVDDVLKVVRRTDFGEMSQIFRKKLKLKKKIKFEIENSIKSLKNIILLCHKERNNVYMNKIHVQQY